MSHHFYSFGSPSVSQSIKIEKPSKQSRFPTNSKEKEEMDPKKTKRQYKFKCTFSGTVADAMRRRGWIEVEENKDDWDIFWCDMTQLRDIFQSGKALEDHQRIGHFRNCQELSRKNQLVKNLKKLRYRLERTLGKPEADKLDFIPTTYILPSEHKFFVMEFKNNPNLLWIIKPAAGSQGRGIFIFQKIKDYFEWRQRIEFPSGEGPTLQPPPSATFTAQTVDTMSSSSFDNTDLLNNKPSVVPVDQNPTIDDSCSQAGVSSSTDATSVQPASSIEPDAFTRSPTIRPDAFVVQRYISNPYLIGGRKFDIRFYVLVTSFQPLKAWVYREGFARFSAGQFSLDALQDVYIHLTNVAIQKTSEDYNPEKGSKWSLRSLREYLTARHGNEKVQKMMNQIDYIVIRTLQSAANLVVQDRHCFEVYGFDVILDSNLFPWLLEVNACPAFTPSNEEDYILKCGLIDDTTSVLDLEGRLTGFEKRVGGYDLIWSDGPVYANSSDCGYSLGIEDGPKLNSFLGCVNDRVQQLRELYRNANFLRAAQKMMTSSAGYKMEGYEDTSLGTGFHCPPRAKKAPDPRFRLPENCPPMSKNTMKDGEREKMV